MKIYILRKSLSNLKAPVEKREYLTEALSVGGFITEMVKRNYKSFDKSSAPDTLDGCVAAALDDFTDGCCYIVNVTKNVRYTSLDDAVDFSDGDEVMLVKLKYVRGIIW